MIGGMLAVSAVLGWSNPDTGPESKRLYALDRGNAPRWALPRARVVETALQELGVSEGSKTVIVVVGRHVSEDQLEQCRLAAARSVARVLGAHTHETTGAFPNCPPCGTAV